MKNPTKKDAKWIGNVKTYVGLAYPAGHNHPTSAAQQIQAMHNNAEAVDAMMELPTAVPISPSNSTNSEALTTPPLPAKERTNNEWVQTIQVDGKDYKITLPSRNWKCVYVQTQGKLEKKVDQLQELQASFNRQRFPQDAPPLTKALMAMALAASPGFALSTLAASLPLMIGAVLYDYGILDHNQFKLERFCSSFPKETWMQNQIIRTAAQCTLKLGRLLAGKRVYGAFDKGKQSFYAY